MNKCEWCVGQSEVWQGPAAMPSWKRTQCLKCGTLAFLKLPDQVELDDVYATAWGDEGNLGELATGTTNESVSRSLLKAVGWAPKTDQRCLDYGGGRGVFANTLGALGCGDVWVYEPYREETPGGGKWVKDLDALPDNSFDWVFMIEVIEHLRDPVAALKIIKRVIVPNGRLVITTPNAKGLRAKRDGYKWREAQNPTHINLFSATGLGKCLTKAGFSKFYRTYKPVTYSSGGWRSIAMTVTQRLGIDGGLRYVAILTDKD